MSSLHVFDAARLLLQDFIENTQQCKNILSVKFYLKQRYYGVKVYVVIRDRNINLTVLNIFMRIRSLAQVRLLRCSLKSARSCIHHYINDVGAHDSDIEAMVVD